LLKISELLQSEMSSIFFLTSIFNISIQSTVAVFLFGPHIHEKWKGRIETWQQRKKVVRRKRRAARKSNNALPAFSREREMRSLFLSLRSSNWQLAISIQPASFWAEGIRNAGMEALSTESFLGLRPETEYAWVGASR